MTTTAELLRTFEQLAISMRANAAQIYEMATADGVLDQVQPAIDSILEQASIAEASAEALRNGDALSLDDLPQ